LNEQDDNKSSRSMTYPVSRMSPSFDLVDIAKQIQQADQMLNVKVGSKLQVIADQIKLLQDEARKILDTAQQDQVLNRAACNFKRIPGTTYHLYQKDNDKLYFSILSPSEWGNTPPHQFKGSYRFEYDHSWTPLESIEDEDSQRKSIQHFIDSLR